MAIDTYHFHGPYHLRISPVHFEPAKSCYNKFWTMATIDVTEILRASSSFEPATKRSRPSVPEQAQQPVVNTATANPEDILAALEQDSAQAVTVDETHIRKLTAQLEKKALKNREMRTKHTDDPKKFMDSEIELDTAIQEMHVLATQPDLYGCFVEAGGPSLMLSLLTHENSDILGATVNLLQELTDVDILNEGEEGAAQLIESLASGRIVESFLTAFDKLDEKVKDDADAIHNALSVVENMIDFRPETAEDCVSQNLFLWLLRRACQKGQFDANKMYASELVALLLQMSESAKRKLTEKVDGIDMLLRALAAYKRHDPESLDEREHMENLFDALCAALMLPANRGKFLDGEGLQLMNLMLRERKQSRESALKVLDHATTGPEGKDNCNKFVEILGLRTLFPLYMRTPSKVKRKDTTPDEHEEHVCAILASLFRSCGDDARQRMMSKFVEHEHEKVDRAIELFIKYREKLAKFEAKRARKEDSSVDEDVDREYLDRLDAGLYTLQNLSLVLADVCAHTSSARHRASKLFSMKMRQDKISKVLLPLLTEYQANIGDGGDEERRRVDLLIARLTKSDRDKEKE
ncbi:hypothetical protein Y032_0154g2979 [Ancylostoma ceylanicum]|uniref:Beta-catenin-like protein 1 n=1 Tax=Ancylostoma ceylanicum TaxID=53326 RepID=A0A016T089_9BILA|nr:hypothetical protein Y032_0154g2979 [Ancylostoma ceylanicum]